MTEDEKLKIIANKLRLQVMDMICKAKYGFLGSCFSSADIITVLGAMEDIKCFEDKKSCLIISKGHIAPLLYVAMDYFKGTNLCDNNTYAAFDSCLQAHPNHEFYNDIPIASGSLGLGVSAAIGYSIGLRLNKSSKRVFALIGDGELQEGIVLESLLALKRTGINSNITIILDANGKQSVGSVPNNDIMKRILHNLDFDFYEIDGNSIKDIIFCIRKVINNNGVSIVWANTHRGAGIPDFNEEGGMSVRPSEDEYIRWKDILRGVCNESN